MSDLSLTGDVPSWGEVEQFAFDVSLLLRMIDLADRAALAHQQGDHGAMREALLDYHALRIENATVIDRI